MKILILGADGFVGSHVVKALLGHEVYRATCDVPADAHECQLDLTDKTSIVGALQNVQPEVIINCAGIVRADNDFSLNYQFTKNLLEAVVEAGLQPKRIIISGSAAEYGVVDSLPVPETAPTRAEAGYGLTKAQEVAFALQFAKEHQLPLVVARIFNPLGTGMQDRFLVPALLRQLEEYKAGSRRQLEVGRKDAQRDYLHIDDLAEAIRLLVEGEPKETVYNIGSGQSTSNGELVELVLKNSKLDQQPEVVETSDTPEPRTASQADITRLKIEFGWACQRSIEQAIKEIVDEKR